MTKKTPAAVQPLHPPRVRAPVNMARANSRVIHPSNVCLPTKKLARAVVAGFPIRLPLAHPAHV